MSEFPPAPGDRKGHQGPDAPSPETSLDLALMDAVSDAFQAAFLIYDRNDELIFASRSVTNFLPLPPEQFQRGNRLRRLLEAAYDLGLRAGEPESAAISRDEWLTRQIAAHWKERHEIQASEDGKRWTRYSKRRLPSGHGFCIMTDISEQKRREEQWRADVERVQLTEEILDNLAHPVFVQDRNLQLVAVNKVFCSALSIGADNALGADLRRLFDADLAESLQSVSRDVLDSGITASITQCMRLYGDPPRPILVHVQRVGKPGRYFVVASLGEVGATGLVPIETPSSAAAPPASSELSVRTDQSLAGRKAFVVSADPRFEATALDILELLGLDSCCVRGEEELDAFLDAARSVGVVIDLAVFDVKADPRCLEILQAAEVDYTSLSQEDVASELAFIVLERLSALRARPAPADDWEIDTEQQAASETPPPTSPIPPLKSSLVLVAEDNEINQIVFSQILEGLGYSYRICADGEEVVRLWAELNPAIILMDVTLPGLNGFEAARRIRETGRSRADATPIIGVLAQAFDRDREACYASGMDDVILKPLSPDIVEQALMGLVPQVARATNG
ncbi:response regulator [Rhizobium glycinendophyticum]|uniref:Response regulator n=1 Tax=Rhizobium glycinendophyticum TaxID=2589807 RepID=A0A504U4U3_9HYPH|nr:response regulator [Rhizobium glycinendophyticum]TPP10074.1 response regulator [Rhizobium glycinendophyticum]